MLERNVSDVTAFVQFVVSVAACPPETVILTSAFPGLDSVKTFDPEELTRMLETFTGIGKVIEPDAPPLAMKIPHVEMPAHGDPSTNDDQVSPA